MKVMTRTKNMVITMIMTTRTTTKKTTLRMRRTMAKRYSISFFSSNHVSAVLDSAILTDYFNSMMKTRILEGGPWTTCMLVSVPMMTTLSMIKLLINNNSWIFVNFSLNESEIV